VGSEFSLAVSGGDHDEIREAYAAAAKKEKRRIPGPGRGGDRVVA
jgi:hypothetical protein